MRLRLLLAWPLFAKKPDVRETRWRGETPSTVQNQIFLCPPTFYDVTYSINPFMDPSVKVDRVLAWRQWSRFVDALERRGLGSADLDPGRTPERTSRRGRGVPGQRLGGRYSLPLDGERNRFDLSLRWSSLEPGPSTGYRTADRSTE
jgi:hypothetical protein